MTTTTSVDPAFQNLVNSYFTSNPNATQQQVANTISTQGGMTPEIAQALANHYGTDVATVNSTYNNLIGNTGAQSANTSTSNSPLTANAANISNATTQTSPLTQLQGVQNNIQGITNQTSNASNDYFSNPFFNTAYQSIKDSAVGGGALPTSALGQASSLAQTMSDIDTWYQGHPNATTADITSALQSSGHSTSDIQNALSSMAYINPTKYEGLMQSFNTAESIDPSKAFNSWLQQNSTMNGLGMYQLPNEGDIVKEANKLGYNLTNTPSVGALQNQLFQGSPISNPTNYSGISKANNIASTLAAKNNSDAYSILNGQADAQTQNQYNALVQALGTTPTNDNYQNITKLASTGVTPDTYAKLSGVNPQTAVQLFNYSLDPQAHADLLATQAGLTKGTPYTYGVNAYNTPVIMYTDPKTKQQMVYTAGGGAGYQNIPAAQAQSSFLPPHNQGTSFTYGQSSYVSPFNSKGQVDTTNAAALDSAYKNNIISMTDYLNAKQALAKKTT